MVQPFAPCSRGACAGLLQNLYQYDTERNTGQQFEQITQIRIQFMFVGMHFYKGSCLFQHQSDEYSHIFESGALGFWCVRNCSPPPKDVDSMLVWWIRRAVDFGSYQDINAAFLSQKRANAPGMSPPFCSEY